jgi:dTDP-4-dehydrorhamnose reductase
VNSQKSSCLVVGADGLVGARLVAILEKVGAGVTGTTRRQVAAGGKNLLFLDLADTDTKPFQSSGYSVAFLCAAITSIAACENDPAGTQQINVINTIAIAKRLLAAGTRIVFLSSNTVFDGTSGWPDEDTAYSPTCEYGRQKVAAERQLLSLSSPETPVAILRLSKVLTPRSGMVAEFLRHFAAGESCPAFEDLSLCPISLDYTIEALLAVARSGLSGIFHLSGQEETNYANFARQLAIYLSVDPALVRPSSSATSQARVLFRPAHPGLGMQRTRERLGIGPETLNDLMSALAPARSQKVIHQ